MQREKIKMTVAFLSVKFFFISDNEIPILKKYITRIEKTKTTANLVIPIYLRTVRCKRHQ